MISSCYVALYGQARIMCVVARDHMLPPVLARIAPATGTPAIAAVVMGAVTGVPPCPQPAPNATPAPASNGRPPGGRQSFSTCVCAHQWRSC